MTGLVYIPALNAPATLKTIQRRIFSVTHASQMTRPVRQNVRYALTSTTYFHLSLELFRACALKELLVRRQP